MTTPRRALAIMAPFYVAVTLLAVVWLQHRDRQLNLPVQTQEAGMIHLGGTR